VKTEVLMMPLPYDQA